MDGNTALKCKGKHYYGYAAKAFPFRARRVRSTIPFFFFESRFRFALIGKLGSFCSLAGRKRPDVG